MLQCRSSHCKLNSLLGGFAIQQAVNQAAAEGVAAAHTVDNVQVIQLGEAVLVGSNVVQHCAPIVVKCRFALTQSDRNLLKVELVSQLLCNGLVALFVQLACIDISVLCLDAEHVFCVLLIGDANVNILADFRHRLASFVTSPQLAAVVQIAADFSACLLSRLASLDAQVNHVFAQRRSDAGEVEPIHTVKNLFPVEVARLCVCNCRVCTVVDANAAALRSTLLEEVDAHTVAAAHDFAGADAIAAQAVHAHLTDGVFRQLGDEVNVYTIVCQGNSNVCLAAAEGGLEGICLHKTQIVVRLQAQHNFTKSNYFSHWNQSPLLFKMDYFCTRCTAKPAISSCR